jgi:hypothetical protein
MNGNLVFLLGMLTGFFVLEPLLSWFKDEFKAKKKDKK